MERASSVLSNSISIAVAGRFRVIAPEGTPLPHTVTIPARILDENGAMQVSVLSGGHPLCEVLIQHVPSGLAAGSTVELILTIHDEDHIDARAYYPSLELIAPVEMVMTARGSSGSRPLV